MATYDHEIKQRILNTAIIMFDELGFHGTTIRNIAIQANCSLPMMYYYYKNKAALYEEIAVNQFFRIIKEMNTKLNFHLPPAELYTQVALQRQNLGTLEKAVYRIANRLWLGFEGTKELRNKIIDWEKDRIQDNRRILDRYVKNDDEKQMFAEIFLGFLENEVNKTVFFNKEIDVEYLKKQLTLLLKGVG